MKLTFITLLASVLFISTASATVKTPTQNPFMKKNSHGFGHLFLMADSIPNLIGFYMRHGGNKAVKLTDKQEEIIENKFAEMAKFIPKTGKKVQQLQNQVAMAVLYKNQNTAEVKATVKQIAELKTQMSLQKIEAIHLIKNTLSAEQYQQLLDAALNNRMHHH